MPKAYSNRAMPSDGPCNLDTTDDLRAVLDDGLVIHYMEALRKRRHAIRLANPFIFGSLRTGDIDEHISGILSAPGAGPRRDPPRRR